MNFSEDFEFTNDLLKEDNDVILFSAVSSFTQRNLIRIQDYSEVTIPRYLPDEFKNHFCTQKQVLFFLWIMTFVSCGGS